MKLSFKKKIVTTAVVTAVLTAAAPASTAFAINRVDCGNRTDLVRLVENHKDTYCYANKGYTKLFPLTGPFWASKISAGNNDIRWIADGQSHDLNRGKSIHFPTVGTVKLTGIEIK